MSTLVNLDVTSNWRFYINTLVDTNFYLKRASIIRTYPVLKNKNYGIYSLNAKFRSMNDTLVRNYNVTDGKNILYSIYLNFMVSLLKTF